MKLFFRTLIFSSSLLLSSLAAEMTQDEIQSIQSQSEHIEANYDKKNVLGISGDIIILRSFSEGSIWTSSFESRNCYIEAYNLNTGEEIWHHEDVGMIVSFLIISNQKIIYRNYNQLTCLDLYTGQTLWSKETKGYYSVILGE